LFEGHRDCDEWPSINIYQNVRTAMAKITRSSITALLLITLLTLTSMPARASLFSLAASGTISSNTSGDSTIPIGTPWAFELTYDATAPDLDFELIGEREPTFGRFKNTAEPPALTFFHYQAGDYEVTVDDPADFGMISEILITFTGVNAIDINIHAPTFFPPLAQGPVSFHADFNRFTSPPIFSSDALPTNTALGPGSFEQSTVTLLPRAGAVSSGSVTSLTLTAVPEPSVPGDFNLNGVLDSADIDELSSAIRNVSGDAKYDLNQDGMINDDDRGTWVHDLKQTSIGDADLNGEFDSTDLVQVLAFGEYEDGVELNSTWPTGDWDGDGEFTSGDLVVALADGGYERGPQANVANVPEPTGLFLAIGAGLIATVNRRCSKARHT
jgi:hypothetical protein